MTRESQQGRLDDGLTILRRVRDYEILEDEGGRPRPSSQASIHTGRTGRQRFRVPGIGDNPGADHPGLPGHLHRRSGYQHHQRPRSRRGERAHPGRSGALQHHRPQDEVQNKSNSSKLPLGNRIRTHVGRTEDETPSQLNHPAKGQGYPTATKLDWAGTNRQANSETTPL